MEDRIVTVIDVMRGDLCFSGVMRIVSRMRNDFAAAMPVSAVLPYLRSNEKQLFLKAIDLDGADNDYGSNGYRNGYGDGDGYGDGYGYSNGYRNGYGYGDGYGYSNGYRNGDGYGDGDGYGSSTGDGNGYGNVYGADYGSEYSAYPQENAWEK